MDTARRPFGATRAASAQPRSINDDRSSAVRAQLASQRISIPVRRGWVAALVARSEAHHRADHAIWLSHSDHLLSIMEPPPNMEPVRAADAWRGPPQPPPGK